MRKVQNYQYDCLNEAREILKSIGMPKKLYNARSVMTFCACGEIPDKDWNHVSEDYHGTHDIISFINTHFPNKANLDASGYSENTRESIRKETLKPWTDAGIVQPKPGLATNDRNNAYRFTAEFAALLRKYHTGQWEDGLSSFRASHTAYADQLRQIRHNERGYSVSYGNLSFELSLSKHNKLQKLILDEFAPEFMPGAELLYIGDTSDRNIHTNDERLHNLGVNVFAQSGKLPDIVLYDSHKDLIAFVEAYASTGEFSLRRIHEIKDLCSTQSEVAFITAFLTTKEMLKTYSKIAWDTDIWVAEDPTHLTHKNGDKFLGRSLNEVG